MTSLIDYAYNVAYSAFVGLTIYQLINVLGEFAFGGTPQWHWRKYVVQRSLSTLPLFTELYGAVACGTCLAYFMLTTTVSHMAAGHYGSAV